jgi:hypothetical protein
MAPDHFDESISLILTRPAGLKSIRQGFWPKDRPKPGKCEAARIELLADTTAGCDAEIIVLLHPGYQIFAKQFSEDLHAPPLVRMVKELK